MNIKVNGVNISVENGNININTISKDSVIADIENQANALSRESEDLSKQIRAIKILSNVKAVESFGYKSTEAVNENFKKAIDNAWEKIKSFFKKLLNLIISGFKFIIAKIKQLLGINNPKKQKCVLIALNKSNNSNDFVTNFVQEVVNTANTEHVDVSAISPSVDKCVNELKQMKLLEYNENSVILLPPPAKILQTNVSKQMRMSYDDLINMNIFDEYLDGVNFRFNLFKINSIHDSVSAIKNSDIMKQITSIYDLINSSVNSGSAFGENEENNLVKLKDIENIMQNIIVSYNQARNNIGKINTTLSEKQKIITDILQNNTLDSLVKTYNDVENYLQSITGNYVNLISKIDSVKSDKNAELISRNSKVLNSVFAILNGITRSFENEGTFRIKIAQYINRI